MADAGATTGTATTVPIIPIKPSMSAAPGSGPAVGSLPEPGSAEKNQVKEEEQKEIKKHRALALICTNDRVKDQDIFAQRVERERTKQQDIQEAQVLVSSEINDNNIREQKKQEVQALGAFVSEWLKANGRAGPTRERKWAPGQCLMVVPPELIGRCTPVADEEMIPLLEVDIAEWSMQFTVAEFKLAKDMMIGVTAREWRELQKAGVVFHHLTRSFNVVLVDTVVNHRAAAVSVALMGARQLIRMNGFTTRGMLMDQQSSELYEHMKRRDELNARLAAAAGVTPAV